MILERDIVRKIRKTIIPQYLLSSIGFPPSSLSKLHEVLSVVEFDLALSIMNLFSSLLHYLT